MAFDSIENVKGIFALLDHYSLTGYLGGDRSPLTPEILAMIKEKGYRPAANFLLKTINENIPDQKAIIEKFGLGGLVGKPPKIKASHIWQKILDNKARREDLEMALWHVNDLRISEKTKKALNNLLIILDFLDNKQTFAAPGRIKAEYSEIFNEMGTVPAATVTFNELSPHDKDELRKVFGIQEKLTLKIILQKVLIAPENDTDLKNAFCKIDPKICTFVPGLAQEDGLQQKNTLNDIVLALDGKNATVLSITNEIQTASDISDSIKADFAELSTLYAQGQDDKFEPGAKKAIFEAVKAIGKKRYNDKILKASGLCLVFNKNYSVAVDEFQKISNKSLEVYQLMGWCFAKEGKGREAVAAYKNAIRAAQKSYEKMSFIKRIVIVYKNVLEDLAGAIKYLGGEARNVSGLDKEDISGIDKMIDELVLLQLTVNMEDPSVTKVEFGESQLPERTAAASVLSKIDGANLTWSNLKTAFHEQLYPLKGKYGTKLDPTIAYLKQAIDLALANKDLKKPVLDNAFSFLLSMCKNSIEKIAKQSFDGEDLWLDRGVKLMREIIAAEKIAESNTSAAVKRYLDFIDNRPRTYVDLHSKFVEIITPRFNELMKIDEAKYVIQQGEKVAAELDKNPSFGKFEAARIRKAQAGLKTVLTSGNNNISEKLDDLQKIVGFGQLKVRGIKCAARIKEANNAQLIKNLRSTLVTRASNIKYQLFIDKAENALKDKPDASPPRLSR